MTLVANRQLCGGYGVVAPGQAFDVPDKEARELVARNLAYESEFQAIPPALAAVRASVEKATKERKP